MTETRDPWPQPPAVPICRDETGAAPCRFATVCPERRQRQHHYDADPPLRGMACYAFQHLTDLAAAEETRVERAAMQQDGQ